MERENALHPRNIHNQQYDFDTLIKDHPRLSSFVKKNQHDALGIDFSDANAVQSLNQALLAHHYRVKDWSVPEGHLCPPVPGRADYIHYVADLLGESFDGKPPVGTKVKGLDIGTGISCIYPILGNSIYGWRFVGSEISADAINHIKKILNSNPTLKKNIKIRFQNSANHMFKGLIKPDEKFDFTICNPPFYCSQEEAKTAYDSKVNSLNRNRAKKGHAPINKEIRSNFGGINAEVWCPGGEVTFIKQMIRESITVKEQCRWFTTLVSNKAHLAQFKQQLKDQSPAEVRAIEMHHGKKISHILAWKF